MASRQMKMPVKDDAEKSPEAASRGLGLAMAEALAEVGAIVFLNGRDANTLKVAADIAQASVAALGCRAKTAS